jgi:hypothetical protein
MAVALALILGLAATGAARSGETPVTNRVNLQIQVLGVEADGCTVEIRPGHGDCKFTPVTRKVQPTGGAPVKLDTIALDCVSTHADRDCAFAITIKEPGRPPRTYRRGLALKAQAVGQPVPVQSFPCVLSTPSLASKDDPTTKRR